MNYPVQNSLMPSFHCPFSPLPFLASHPPSFCHPPSLPPTFPPDTLPPSGVIDSRHSSQQVLDHLPVERERGITVKAQTASIVYHWQGQQFLLNLIDTPVGCRLSTFYSQLNPWLAGNMRCVYMYRCAMCMYSVHTCLCTCTCIYMHTHVACRTLWDLLHTLLKCLIESYRLLFILRLICWSEHSNEGQWDIRCWSEHIYKGQDLRRSCIIFSDTWSSTEPANLQAEAAFSLKTTATPLWWGWGP